MRISCDRVQLQNAISIVSRVISSKNTMPILDGIYMETMEGSIKLIATDLQKGIETIIPAIIEEPGEIVLPGRFFSDITRKLPNDTVSIYSEDEEAHINCGFSKTTIQTMPAVDFPPLPSIENGTQIMIKQSELLKMINQTSFATADDEARPILTGAYLEFMDEKCNMVALDGYRLAMRSGHIDSDYTGKQAVIPAASLGDIAKIIADVDDNIELLLTESHLCIQTDNIKMITRLMDGEYIRYRQIIPTEWQTRIKVNRVEFTGAIDRASTLSRDMRSNLIKMSIVGNKMVITSNSEIGNIYDEVAVNLEGKNIDIAFNARFLTDVFKRLDDEEIYMNFTTNVSPSVIVPVDNEDYLFLVLPVRVLV